MTPKNLKNSEVPSVRDWENAISNIPVEKVFFNKDSSINREKSPDFYD